jgi:hypothetical protein
MKKQNHTWLKHSKQQNYLGDQKHVYMKATIGNQ